MLRDLEGRVHDPVEDLDSWIEDQVPKQHLGLHSPEREAAIASM